MDDKTAHYVAQARGCQTVAHTCHDADERALWLRIARDWARLAQAATQPPLKSTSK